MYLRLGDELPRKVIRRGFNTLEFVEEKFPGFTIQASGSSGRLSPIIPPLFLLDSGD